MQPDISVGEPAASEAAPTSKLTRWWNECHWQRRIILSLLTMAIGLLAYRGAKAGMAWVRDRQVDRHFQEAQEAAAAKDWPRARNLARSVLQARPNEFDAFRIWQRSLARTDDPRSYMAASGLFNDPRATREDRLEALHALCAQGPQSLALTAYAMLDQEERETPQASVALAEILLLRGQLTMLEDILRNQPGRDLHPACQLALLRTLCAAPLTPERLTEARELFTGLIASNASAEALAALVVLSATPGGLTPGQDLPDLSAWIDTQPDAQDLHRLLALNPALDGASKMREGIFAAAIKRFLTSAPGDLGPWLVGYDQAALAARVLEDSALSDPAAYVARAQALLADHRMDEIANLLANPTPGVDTIELEYLKVGMARLQQDQAAEARAWNRALQQAPLDNAHNRFIEIAQRAESLAAHSVAERAWVAAIRTGYGRLPLYRDLMPLFSSLSKQNRADDLLELFRILLRLEPQNLELKNNYYYLALILGVNQPEESMARFQQLAAENPNMPVLASSAAMAALMAGQPKLAIDALQYRSTTEQSSMMRSALLGTALLLDDDPDAARPLLAKVDWSKLLPQEAIVFRKLQADKQAANLPLPALHLPNGDRPPTPLPPGRLPDSP